MKKLKIIILIIAAIVITGYFVLQDNPEDFVTYQTYASGLKSFETDYGTMKYYDEGEGQVILLVHGVPTNSWMYRNLGKQLSENGYRVIAPDLIGFGASQRVTNYNLHDFDIQAETLFALMEGLEIDSWEQVTHDMGEIISWHMAKEQPEKISHMYILNTILYAETFNPPADFSYSNPVHRFVLGLYAHPSIGKLIVNMMITNGTRDYIIPDSVRVGYWLPIRDGAMSLVHFFTHTKYIKENIDTYRSWLVDSGISVSVLWGEDDPFLDSSSAQMLQQEMNISDNDIVILKGARHLVAEESYQEIAEFIIEHE
jgi:haloalkane dehalogenase